MALTPGALQRWAPWALFTVAVLGLPLLLMGRAGAPPPELGPAPPFQLTDQRGEVVTELDLQDGIAVVDFIFTRCPDVCPLLSSKMALLDEALATSPRLRRPVHLVSVTVDPGHDTPEVLAEYADRYGAEHPRWRFLTGSQADIEALVAGFDLALDRIPMDEAPPSIVHSERFVLIDHEGVVRGFYPSDEEGMEQLKFDARAVAGTWW